MTPRPEPNRLSIEAIDELAELLRLSHSAINRAQRDLNREAFNVAYRMSQHLRYLRSVCDLLMHEATRDWQQPSEILGAEQRARALEDLRQAETLLASSSEVVRVARLESRK